MPKLAPLAANVADLLGPDWVAAIEDAPLPSLSDGPVQPELVALIDSRSTSSQGGSLTTKEALLRSALWLLAGDIDRSHDYSQSIENAEGSFWHGIMHRREQDFGNARYWFRRVGEHPVIDQLKSLTQPGQQDVIGFHDVASYADGIDFVDHCESSLMSGENESIQKCQRTQWIEWQCLLAYCIQ